MSDGISFFPDIMSDRFWKVICNLGIESSKMPQDPEKVVFNYSSHVLTESEKNLLCKGLNFAIPSDEFDEFWFFTSIWTSLSWNTKSRCDISEETTFKS